MPGATPIKIKDVVHTGVETPQLWNLPAWVSVSAMHCCVIFRFEFFICKTEM